MKTILTSIIAVALLTSCASTTQNALINSAVTIGVTSGLRYAISDPAKRTVVANYIDYGAAWLRAVTGTPSPDELTARINAAIPTSVKNNYPELLAFLEPLVISQYQSLYTKYGTTGNAAKIYAGLNQIALDLEAGAAPYVTK